MAVIDLTLHGISHPSFRARQMLIQYELCGTNIAQAKHWGSQLHKQDGMSPLRHAWQSLSWAGIAHLHGMNFKWAPWVDIISLHVHVSGGCLVSNSYTRRTTGALPFGLVKREALSKNWHGPTTNVGISFQAFWVFLVTSIPMVVGISVPAGAGSLAKPFLKWPRNTNMSKSPKCVAAKVMPPNGSVF